jgi:DNA-binding Lrp family transcriptional regulator
MRSTSAKHLKESEKNSLLTKGVVRPGSRNQLYTPDRLSRIVGPGKTREHDEARYYTGIKLDKIGINIIKELLGDPNIKSADIAARLRVPLSTIQRRRMRLESTSILRKAYELDLARLGWREAELLVTVQKGKCRNIANLLLSRFKNNVRSCTLRIGDPEVNVAADIIYRNSPELLEIIDTAKNMDFVSYVEWSEITEVVGENNIDMRLLLETVSQ